MPEVHTIRDKNIHFSIVIPVYNEEKTLNELYKRLTNVMRQQEKDYEIIFVDDGSKDSSFKVLKELNEKDNRIVVLRFSRNFGQHPAVIAGFHHIRGEVIITLDADLQNPPEEIPKLLEKLKEGYDVVTGYRVNRRDSFLVRSSSFIVGKIIAKIAGSNLRDYGCMLRVYTREAIEKIKLFKERVTYITLLTSWMGLKIAEIETSHDSRFGGKSKYSLLGRSKLFINIITDFSTFPIRAISFVGISFIILGIFGMLSSFFCSIFYTFTAFLILIIGGVSLFFLGVQFIILGILGAYIARIYVEVQARPYFIIEEKLG